MSLVTAGLSIMIWNLYYKLMNRNIRLITLNEDNKTININSFWYLPIYPAKPQTFNIKKIKIIKSHDCFLLNIKGFEPFIVSYYGNFYINENIYSSISTNSNKTEKETLEEEEITKWFYSTFRKIYTKA